MNLPSHEEVELLIRPPELDVGLEGDRVVGLKEGVEKLMETDRDSRLVPLQVVVSFEDSGHGVLGGKADHVFQVHLAQPLGVELDDGLLGVQNLEDLALIGLGVFQNLLFRQGGAGLVPAGRVSDERREVSDQKDNPVAEDLEVAQFAQEHRMTKVDVRSGGVEAGLDRQGAVFFIGSFQFLQEFLFRDNLRGSFTDQFPLLGGCLKAHGRPPQGSSCQRWRVS